jgi:hypothetical protein
MSLNTTTCVRECIVEKFPEYNQDLTAEQWKMIDAGEKYGRIRFNEALADIKLYIEAGWIIDSNNIDLIIERLSKPV